MKPQGVALRWWVIAAAACLAVCWPACPAGAEEGRPEATPDEIARLIAELGHDDYFVRERAQDDLRQIGLEAFDALAAAENHDDVEIAARAKYLVRLLRVEWVADDDPPEVKAILANYEAADEKVRLEAIRQLAMLAENKGVPALCRLVRFEKSQVVSKRAALALIEQEPAEELDSSRRAQAIRRALGASSRAAAEWLKVHLATRRDPAGGVGAWAGLAESEEKTLGQYPIQTRPEIVAALWRREVALLRKLDRRDEALAAMLKIVALEQGTSETLLDLLRWLVDQQAWNVVDEVAARFADRFERDALLLYALADARRAQGNDELAHQTAQRAVKLNEANPFQRFTLVIELQRRRLGNWAELELRQVIEKGPPGHIVTLVCQRNLAEMLHDRGDESAAAKLLEDAAQAMENNLKLDKEESNGPLKVGPVRARIRYFRACHAEALGDRAGRVDELRAGLDSDPLDVDVLIALYRITDLEPELRQRTRRLIAEGTVEFRRQIEEEPNDPTPYNQLAWLLSNTEGDQDLALRSSQKSLELKPDEAAYLDTLGRCYYAQGDYGNAVKYQTKAVEIDPHSGLMKKQLAVFREALAKAQEDKP